MAEDTQHPRPKHQDSGFDEEPSPSSVSPFSQEPDPMNKAVTTSIPPSFSPDSDRIDSAVGIEHSPVEYARPDPEYPQTPRRGFFSRRRESRAILPPLISGHGHLIRSSQTIPTWMGFFIVVGVLGWACWCAENLVSGGT